MRELVAFLMIFAIGWIGGAAFLWARQIEAELPSVTLPPVEVTEPACEWGGPYPGFVEGTEMWIVICAEGEGDG